MEKFIQELEPYKNTLVILIDKIVRIYDVIDDDEDYYWVCDNGDKIEHVSCVISWSPLKNIISDNEYKYILNIWNLNNSIKAI